MTARHPARLRFLGGAVEHRRVTWLELFFDLVFVAAVAQVALPLHGDYSPAGLLRFALLFVLIWWTWIGHAQFATRFGIDDGPGRGLTLLQMFGVAVMAANAGDALDSRSSAGFAAAYAVLRFILVAQYLRVRHLPEAHGLARRSIAGHGAAAALWLASALVPAPERFVLWAVAFVIDLGTPWFAVRHSVAAPPHAHHLPERFGLFTLILLGESVVAVMHGIEHQEHWSVPAATLAFAGMGLAFLFWWWYFDAGGATAPKHVATHRDAVRLHIWSYAHLPLYLSIVATFVGMRLIVAEAPAHALRGSQLAILGSAIALSVLSLGVVSRVTKKG